MAIQERVIQNKRNSSGELTGKPGIVYDVNIKYKSDGKRKTYVKKGFSTKKEALQHEAIMKAKLSVPSYIPPAAVQRKQTVKEYMLEWIERHGDANLRPSTKAGYLSTMKNHIFPYIGDVPLGGLTPAMLYDMYAQIKGKGLSNSVVRYTHRIMSVALEHARKYHYIESNPAKDKLTKFGKDGKTPDPYTVEQMQQLLANVIGTEWELIIILAGLYGLRMGEILGLRWRNVDLQNRTFSVVEQMPYAVPATTKLIPEMAPVKAGERELPITEWVLPYFETQLERQNKQKCLMEQSGQVYYDNDLVLAKADGSPLRKERISTKFAQWLRHLGMPKIRFHDLRHTAATNLHELTGDFFTTGEILGHSTKGIGIQLRMSNNLDSVTSHYVNVRVNRKLVVLNEYHSAVFKGIK